MEQDNGVHFSLFKPHNEYSRRNRNIILSMLVIWAVAVFGFQIMLRVFEKPTPEPSFIEFEKAWPSMLSGNSSIEQQQELTRSLLMVVGKTSVKPNDKAILDSALTLIVFNLANDSLSTLVKAEVATQKEAISRLPKADDAEYLAIQETVRSTKANIAIMLCPLLGFSQEGLEATLLPFHLLPNVETLSPDLIKAVETTMARYAIHNQSFLTDRRFIGFPFHYFYTAVFLLILFVLLCYLYNVRIERLQKKFGIEE